MIDRLMKALGRLLEPLQRLLDPRQYALRYAIAEAGEKRVVLIQGPRSLGGEWWAAYRVAPDASVEQIVEWLLGKAPAFSVWQLVGSSGVTTMVFLPLNPSGGLWEVEGLEPVSDVDQVLDHLGHPREGEVVISI
jgi:hypothetical protein